MTYRIDNKTRKYVKGYEFMSFAKNIASINQSKYGKMIKNQVSEFGKIASKKIFTKSEEARGDLIGSKIADKITSFKSKEKPQEIEEEQEIIIPPDKRQQVLNDLRLF